MAADAESLAAAPDVSRFANSTAFWNSALVAISVVEVTMPR